jgi:malonate transporter
MQGVAHVIALTAPLFLLVALGYALIRWADWPEAVSEALTRFVFAVAVPALLFRLMSDFSRLPPVDARLLIAFFGGSLVVFGFGRMFAGRVLGIDGVASPIFAMGGIFGNTLLLGIPIAKVTLGDGALPAISLILVFNSLVCWTLVTACIEWARTRQVSLVGIAKTARNVALNPVVGSILLGTAWGWLAVPLPDIAGRTLDLVGQAAVPLSLIALGMGLAEFGIGESWRESAAITFIKLAVQPLVVYALARALALPQMETQAIVLIAAMPVGANVYLMAREFGALAGPVAASLVLSTLVATVTAPAVVVLTSGG